MNANLERLIRLQQLDTITKDASHRLEVQPAQLKELDRRIDEATATVAAAKEQLAQNQTAKRAVEKDVAMHQGRLSKFREQAMAVKTNQEYHAIQHEIAFAEKEIKTLEDKILEGMLEADDLTSAVKRSEAALAAEKKAIESERQALAGEVDKTRQTLDQTAQQRSALAREIDPQVLATFELVSQRRHGVGLAEAKNGICSICHVRLRPQVFNTVMRNEQILQCDSCNRILYYTPPAPAVDASAQPAS